MTKKARQYKSKDIKKLFAFSGNQCAEPSCERKMISDDGNNVLGEIAHISAASSEGPRFNVKMTDDDRRSFENLILLCNEHHKMIDNPDTVSQYPVTLIEEWKQNHKITNKKSPIDKKKLKELLSNITISAGGAIHVGDKIRGDKISVSHSKNVNIGGARNIKDSIIYQTDIYITEGQQQDSIQGIQYETQLTAILKEVDQYCAEIDIYPYTVFILNLLLKRPDSLFYTCLDIARKGYPELLKSKLLKYSDQILMNKSYDKYEEVDWKKHEALKRTAEVAEEMKSDVIHESHAILSIFESDSNTVNFIKKELGEDMETFLECMKGNGAHQTPAFDL